MAPEAAVCEDIGRPTLAEYLLLPLDSSAVPRWPVLVCVRNEATKGLRVGTQDAIIIISASSLMSSCKLEP